MRFERVRSARGRRLSSTRWLQRQLNDPYVQAAKRDGYRSRAAYKLLQIDDRFELLKLGCRVVDLGAAPGGWTQVAVNRVQSMDGHPSVVAIDILEMEPLPQMPLRTPQSSRTLASRVFRSCNRHLCIHAAPPGPGVVPEELAVEA